MSTSAAHVSFAASVANTLFLNTTEAWFGLIPVIQGDLSEPERVKLAWVSLKSVDPDNAAKVVETFHQSAGMPIAPLINHMDEAAFWSDMASSEELEAYCLASFTKMPRGRQAAFLDYVQGRAAA